VDREIIAAIVALAQCNLGAAAIRDNAETMDELSPSHRENIEQILERRLTADELAPADRLVDLNASVIAVARVLARSHSVLCIVYLKAVAPVSLPQAMDFLDRLRNDGAE